MAIGARSAILRAAKGTTWSQFVDYASPALFEVMPIRRLFAQGREFIANSRDQERFGQTRAQIASALDSCDVRVMVSEPDDGPIAPLSELAVETRRDVGHRVLEIYFAQLFAAPRAILDLRADAFRCTEPAELTWSPRSLYVEWKPDFLARLRDVYTGFYLDDESRFERGLVGLGLEQSGDLLLTHLGSDDQRRVRFSTRAFHSSFHEMFLRCRDRGVSLHQNFLALGIYLVCLYDALEALDLEFDVRGAFERSHHDRGSATSAR